MLEHKILGGDAQQVVVVQLEVGQAVYAKAGRFRWKTPNVGLSMRPAGQVAAGAGLLDKAVATAIGLGRRRLAGQDLAFQHFAARGGAGLVAFSGVLPGAVRALELDGTRAWLVGTDAVVAAETSVGFDLGYRGWRAGLDGEGLAFERFGGAGTLLVAGAGALVELNPAGCGGSVQVDAGCVVAVQEGVDAELERPGALDGQRLLVALLGGRQARLATLSGDGTVWLQSLPLAGLARAVAAAAGTGAAGATDRPATHGGEPAPPVGPAALLDRARRLAEQASRGLWQGVQQGQGLVDELRRRAGPAGGPASPAGGPAGPVERFPTRQ